jgi:hypothetical protein
MRLDVFQAKVAAEKNIKDTGEWDKLDAEQQRLVEKMIWDELMKMKKELSQTCLDFRVNQFIDL